MRADTYASRVRPDSELVDVAVEVFRLLADATRIRIVLALQAGELSVNALAEAVERSPAAVSQHLAKLRWAKVVLVRKDGNRVFYRLADEHALRLVAEGLMQAEHTVEDAPGHHA